MVDITLLEVHLEEGSFSASLPFSSYTQHNPEEDETDDEVATAEFSSDDDDDESNGGSGKAKAVLGVFVFLVIAGAVVRYLSGDDEPEVEIETPDDGPVGVTVDTDEE